MSSIENKQMVISAGMLDASVRRRIDVLSHLDATDRVAWRQFAESLAGDYLAGLPARWAVFNFLTAVPEWVADIFLEKSKFFEAAACRNLDWFLHKIIERAVTGNKADRLLAQAWVMRAHRHDALRPNVARAYLPMAGDKVTEYLLKEVLGEEYLPDSSLSKALKPKKVDSDAAAEKQRRRKANLAERAAKNRKSAKKG
jgi:hypothetical protein